MQCPNCGKNNVPNAKFCENCGQSLVPTQQNLIQPLPPKKSNAGKYILGIFIGLLLSLLAVGVIILANNSLAKRPATDNTKIKKVVVKDSGSSKKKESASEKESSSERKKASSTEVENSSSSSQSENSRVPSPVLADGQITSWTTNLAGTGDEEILVIQGTDQVTMSHNTAGVSGTNMHNDGTFTIENANADGTSFTIDTVGDVTISGDTLTLDRQGHQVTYHFKTYTQSDAGAKQTTPDSYSDDDDFYEAD